MPRFAGRAFGGKVQPLAVKPKPDRHTNLGMLKSTRGSIVPFGCAIHGLAHTWPRASTETAHGCTMIRHPRRMDSGISIEPLFFGKTTG